jgi:hypothetical protein
MRCFCPPEQRGPFTVQVTDSHMGVAEIFLGDELLEATGPHPDVPEDPRIWWIARGEDLFDLISIYLRSDSIEVRYDEKTGFPMEMRADPASSMIDDETGFLVSDWVAGR